MSSHRLITRPLLAGLAVAALGAPSALAAPPLKPIHPMSEQERQVLASRGQGAPSPIRGPVTHVTKVEPTVPPHASGSGFDWGSAVVGAGAAGGLSILVGIGAFGLADHRRVRAAR